MFLKTFTGGSILIVPDENPYGFFRCPETFIFKSTGSLIIHENVNTKHLFTEIEKY
jgi:hypothetical protein